MNYKKGKIILIALLIFMIIITFYEITKTYALLQSQIQGTASKELGKWEIIVNQEDISSGLSEQFVIDDINITGNNFTLQNTFAPGMTGYFDIIINPQDTDVSIRYDLLIDTSYINNNEIEISSISEINNNTLVNTESNCYTGIIPLSVIKSENNTNTIRITFEWQNNELNNDQDTALGIVNDNRIQIPIQINVTQYLGETIEQI